MYGLFGLVWLLLLGFSELAHAWHSSFTRIVFTGETNLYYSSDVSIQAKFTNENNTTTFKNKTLSFTMPTIAIFHAHNRRRVRINVFPLRQVKRVEQWKGGYGTGTLSFSSIFVPVARLAALFQRPLKRAAPPSRLNSYLRLHILAHAGGVTDPIKGPIVKNRRDGLNIQALIELQNFPGLRNRSPMKGEDRYFLFAFHR